MTIDRQHLNLGPVIIIGITACAFFVVTARRDNTLNKSQLKKPFNTSQFIM